MPNLGVVLAAAGRGIRFGEKKQFLEFRGIPVYLFSLRVFLKQPSISCIVITALEEDLERIELEIFERFSEFLNLNLSKINISIIKGGAERYISVLLGLKKLQEMQVNKNLIDYALIHDVARPLFSQEDLSNMINLISNQIKTLQKNDWPAILPCEKVKDTIKKITVHQNETIVRENLIRNDLASAATPQMVPLDQILKAYQDLGLLNYETLDNNSIPTDDTELYFQAGGKVIIYWLKHINPKITTPEDIKIIENIKL